MGLQFVWISHFHADHHSALPLLIAKHSALTREKGQTMNPLLIVGPPILGQVLSTFSQCFDCAFRFVFLNHSQFDHVFTPSMSHALVPRIPGAPFMPMMTPMAPMWSIPPFGMPSSYFAYPPYFPMSTAAPPQRAPSMLGSIRSGISGIATCQSVPVIHCRDARAIVLDLSTSAATPLRLVYSGDTRPSSALAQAGRGAALCIHEVRCHTGKSNAY